MSKEMTVKEAIERLCKVVRYEEDDMSMVELDVIEASEVITLLQQGEVYKKMWEELYEIASEFNFFPMMDKIEQKYFPKEDEK